MAACESHKLAIRSRMDTICLLQACQFDREASTMARLVAFRILLALSSNSLGSVGVSCFNSGGAAPSFKIPGALFWV